LKTSLDKHNKLGRRPNILLIMVDEERYPPVYEDEAIRRWRAENLKAQNFLRQYGVEFRNHYAASTACAPSRASLYTGQYPSLHGVTQTDGGGDTAFVPGIFWLDPNTVPTFGDYLRTAGYRTYWKGKWHASHPDLPIPGTHDSYLTYDSETGEPLPENQKLYLAADRLGEYGFSGWIGPEPHGSSPRNSGSSAAIGVSGRDEFYADDVISLLDELEKKDDQRPWAIAASFVNPHDIALFGAYTRLLPTFNFAIDPSVPPVPPSPTAQEDLGTKPKVQASYREVYPQLFQPLVDSQTYRRLYYSLQLQVDRQIYRVLKKLQASSFYEDTIIIYTSDHGDLLGAHGGLFQKWYQAYEEAIHVPLIFHNPRLIPKKRTVDLLTSHVDLLPTILGLAGIDLEEAMAELRRDHTEVHRPVGRNLADLILKDNAVFKDEPIYFMTDDDPSKTLNAVTFTGTSFEPVTQPSHIETVIAKLPTGEHNQLQIWKYSRYFDNPQFWSTPGCEDQQTTQENCSSQVGDKKCSLCITTTKRSPKADQFEMYNLSEDPLETRNLAHPEFATAKSRAVQIVLAKLLAEECEKKRRYPESGQVPGKPDCADCGPDFSVFSRIGEPV